MKKLSFLFLLSAACMMNAQVMTVVEAPPHDGGTSAQRAPSGLSSAAFHRACVLVLQSELTGIAPGSTITSFGYTLNNGTASQAVNGSFTVYLQNSSDVSYSKSTTYATAISGMTQVFAGGMTIPVSASSTSIMLTLSTPFVYTGGAIYVATDWASLGPFDGSGCTYLTNYQTLSPGCNSSVSATSAPTVLGSSSSHRPAFLFGMANPYSNDMQIIGLEAPGRVPAMFNTGHNILGIVRNSSNTGLTNVPVNLTITGANPFVNTQTISSLAAGASTIITFPSYNPTTPGVNNITVSVSSDQNNVNNQATYVQTVTCNEWALNPPINNYTNSVGFNTGSGIIACYHTAIATNSLLGLRCAISTNTPSAGNNTWGVLMSSSGAILATTNTITISSSMLGTQQTMYFATPPQLTGGTTYMLGFAQPQNASLGYFPAASLTFPYVSQSIYATTGLTGGTPTPLLQNLGYFDIEALYVPTITLTANSQTVTCGSNVTVTALSSTNYSWNTGATTSSFIVTPTLTTNYSVTATNTLGCAVTKTLSLLITPIQVTATASKMSICKGDIVIISGSGASTYSWNAGSNPTASTFTDNPQTTTAYNVIGSNSAGCSNNAVVVVVVNSFTNLNVSASNMSVCLGNTVTVTAFSGVTYTWQTASNTYTTASIVDQPAANTVYTVTGTNADGCTMSKTVNVTVNTITLSVANNTPLCTGQSASIAPLGAASYSWSNNSPFPILNVTPSVTTTYTLYGTGANTCTNSIAVTVTVNALPVLTVTATKSVVCKGEQISVNVNGANNYTWSSAGGNSATAVYNATFVTTQTFTVIGTNANGCSSTGSITVRTDLCNGIAGLEFQHLQVYPNPATDGIFNLETNGNFAGSRLMVRDVRGVLVLDRKIESDLQLIDLSNYSPGIYLLNVEGSAVTVKLIKN